MVGATATPGQGCSGRFWVMRNKRDYLGVRRHVVVFLRRDMSPRSKTRTCPRTPELGQRASRRNASLRLTLPFAPRPWR
jgi:hypothetical protein